MQTLPFNKLYPIHWNDMQLRFNKLYLVQWNDKLSFTTLWANSADKQINDILIFPIKQDVTFHAKCLHSICIEQHFLLSLHYKKAHTF